MAQPNGASACDAVTTLSSEQQASYATAIDLFRHQRYAAAYGRFVKLADAGHPPSAQLALLMYRNGRALFGSDWAPTAQGGGKLAHGAVAYFPPDSVIRMLRMDGQDFIAITGCVQSACATHRGLLLIDPTGQQLWARLDEGGFSRYYGHGPAMTATPVSPAFIDSAWRAVERVGRA